MKHPLEEKLILIKEIKYNFIDVPNIVGKVYQVIESSVVDYKYCWDINFFNQLLTESEVYRPGTATTFAHSAVEAEQKLEIYAMRFEDAEDWLVNENF